jgi:V/A-type H+-transporting ATPase subunit E
MSLDRLIEEIRSRAEVELATARTQAEADKARIVKERDERSEKIQTQLAQQGETEAKRLRTQRIAGARMQARKLEYEAQERALSSSLNGVKTLLADFTKSDEYPKVLGRMYDLAVDELGKDVRITGRAEDADVLKKLAGKAFGGASQPILGGLVAETSDGSRRLTLSFDELLRLREDRVRGLLS